MHFIPIMLDALKLCVFFKGTHQSVIILHEVDGVQYVHIQMYTLPHILSTPDDTQATTKMLHSLPEACDIVCCILHFTLF